MSLASSPLPQGLASRAANGGRDASNGAQPQLSSSSMPPSSPFQPLTPLHSLSPAPAVPESLRAATMTLHGTALKAAPLHPLHSHLGMTGPANLYVEQRDGEILSRGMTLKADDFPSQVRTSLLLHISGAPNFRQIRPLPICGVGQPSVHGIRTILNLMRTRESVSRASAEPKPVSASRRQAVWINLREEPLIYLNNRPFVLRELDHPFRNMRDFRGISARGLRTVEKRLKSDILREGQLNHDTILVHDEVNMGEVRACWEAVSRHSCATSTEVYEQLHRERYRVSYVRAPMTADLAPSAQNFDSLVEIYMNYSLHPDTFFIFNCQRGMGRSTMGMIIMYLLHMRQFNHSVVGSHAIRAGTPAAHHHAHMMPTVDALLVDESGGFLAPSAPSSSSSLLQLRDMHGYAQYRRGEYDMILKLVRMLKWGAAAKRDVDRAIDVCGRVHNLRDAILESLDKAETARHADRHAFHSQYAAEQLKRYFYLICFQAYLLSIPTPSVWYQSTSANEPTGFASPVGGLPAPGTIAPSPILDRSLPTVTRSTSPLTDATLGGSMVLDTSVRFEYTFQQWLETRPELYRLAEMTASSISVVHEQSGPSAALGPLGSPPPLRPATPSGAVGADKLVPPDPDQLELQRAYTSRRFPVLGPGTILKSEFFTRHADTPLERALISRGMPNFRQLGEYPIAALAQPSVAGIKAVLALFGAHTSSSTTPSTMGSAASPMPPGAGDATPLPKFGATLPPPSGLMQFTQRGRRSQVLWINLREEPVIYINDQPFLLRDIRFSRRCASLELKMSVHRHPFRCLLEFNTGMTPERSEQLEMRLKVDVLAEAARCSWRLPVHIEGSHRKIQARWESVPSAEGVQTTRELYDSLASQGYRVKYFRVPLNVGETPALTSFDLLCGLLSQDQLMTHAVIRDRPASVTPTVTGSSESDASTAQGLEWEDTHIVFNCQRGGRRSTMGMVVACLLLGHYGFHNIRLSTATPTAAPNTTTTTSSSSSAALTASSAPSLALALSPTPEEQLPSAKKRRRTQPGGGQHQHEHAHARRAIEAEDDELEHVSDLAEEEHKPEEEEEATGQLLQVPGSVSTAMSDVEEERDSDQDEEQEGEDEIGANVAGSSTTDTDTTMTDVTAVTSAKEAKLAELRFQRKKAEREEEQRQQQSRASTGLNIELVTLSASAPSTPLPGASGANGQADVASPRASSTPRGSHGRGEYKGILGLIRILKRGAMLKQETDAAIDLCGSVHNIRESISLARYQAESERNQTKPGSGLDQSVKYLESYAFLICFNAYLHDLRERRAERAVAATLPPEFHRASSADDRKATPLKRPRSDSLGLYVTSLVTVPGSSPDLEEPTFSQWMTSRPELLRYLEHIRKDSENMLKLDTFASDDEYAFIYENRCGSVLTRGTILKSDYFVGCASDALPQSTPGAVNFRALSCYPVGGTGSPTANGVANVLKYFASTSASGTAALVSAVWMNMREEPVIYINESPYVLRDFDQPNANIENTGITARRVEAMEKQLKKDVLDEITRYSGRLLVHEEDDDGNQIALFLRDLNESSIKTSKELYAEVFTRFASAILDTPNANELPTNNNNAPSGSGADAMTSTAGSSGGTPSSVALTTSLIANKVTDSDGMQSPSARIRPFRWSLMEMLEANSSAVLRGSGGSGGGVGALPTNVRILATYYRTPITDEQAPSVALFDQFVRNMESMVAVIQQFASTHHTTPAQLLGQTPQTSSATVTTSSSQSPALAIHDIQSFFVLNCQMGRGRTTTAMILACLWCMHRGKASADVAELRRLYAIRTGRPIPTSLSNTSLLAPEVKVDFVVDEITTDDESGAETDSDAPSSAPPPIGGMSGGLTRKPGSSGGSGGSGATSNKANKEALLRGEYKMVQSLVRVIPDGVTIKQQTDAVIDHCDHMQNLRAAIYDLRSRAQTALPSRRPELEMRCMGYLARYFFLIVFNAYFRDESATNFAKSFASWYRDRPEIKNILESYRKQNDYN